MSEMKNTIQGLKAGIKGFFRGLGPGQYEAGGRQVVCAHCGGKNFAEHEALLNTTGATFVKLDWLNKSGTALICENCGLIQWFGKRPESTSQDVQAAQTRCSEPRDDATVSCRTPEARGR
jgi:uncharacterized protein